MSSIFFCVIGSPICTAEVGEDSLSASEEKVAPWMPSLPILPPTITARSPGRTLFVHAFFPRTRAGRIPPVPQNTSGLPRKLSSKRNPPATTGMPDWLPPSTMPLCTPSRTRRGCSSPSGTSAGGVPG